MFIYMRRYVCMRMHVIVPLIVIFFFLFYFSFPVFLFFMLMYLKNIFHEIAQLFISRKNVFKAL